MRPNEKPVAVTEMPPEDGELKVPETRTKIIGASKLANLEIVENCWPTVALADTWKPLPEATLHKIAEFASQNELSHRVS